MEIVMTTKQGLSIWILVLGLSACFTPFDPLVEDSHGREIAGSGHVVSEVRSVVGFTEIEVVGGQRVVVQRSHQEGVEVFADDNLLHLIETEVRDGTLFVGSADGYRLRPSEQITVFVDAMGLAQEFDPTDHFPFRHLERCRKVVVAAVNGLCHAGGLDLMMSCDVAIASERARFRAPELLRGAPDPVMSGRLASYVDGPGVQPSAESRAD